MNINEVHCELLKKDTHTHIEAVLEEFHIDPLRLKDFLKHPQNLAFVAKYNNKITGFIYGYSLMSLDSDPQLFVYSVEVLTGFQNMGIGSKLFQYVVDFSRENGFSECYVITDKGNKRACRIYEKAGGKNDYEDEIVYVIKHTP